MARDQGVDVLTAAYSRFDAYEEIRRETFGEDLGQSGWTTAAEQDRFIKLLELRPGQRFLDVACGSGGPTLRIVERTGATAHGIDIHRDGIAAATKEAAARGLSGSATFAVADASVPLEFADGSFDAVTCIDAICHLPDRNAALGELARVLRPGGKLLFTDPFVVAGALSSEEIATRSTIGFFLFVAPDFSDRVIASVGLETIGKEDVTENVPLLAERWHAARVRRETRLRTFEGDKAFDAAQQLLDVAARVARERRLSRYLYLARK